MARQRTTRNTPASPGIVPAGPTARENTLGMSMSDLDIICDRLDAHGGAQSHKRRSARLAFRQTSISLEVEQPGGGQTHIKIACRNLSSTGLGFLHSSYMHEGTRVFITLSHQNHASVRVAAKVVRCRHITRRVHDVGVAFVESINVRDFMDLDPLNQTFTSEVVNPAALAGSLLVVAEYKIERGCIQSMLSETSLDFIGAPTLELGLDEARKGVAVILCDDVFEKGSGSEFVVAARNSGVRSPIILMSGDTTEQGLARIRQSNADAFLAKPIKQDLLLRAVAEFLLMGGDRAQTAETMYPTLPPGSPMLDLADALVDDLRTIAEQIESLAKAGDIPGVRKQCLRIGGPAASLGFEPISIFANGLIESLDSTKSIEQSTVALNTFVAACRSARKAKREPVSTETPAGEAAPAPKETADDSHGKPKKKAA